MLLYTQSVHAPHPRVGVHESLIVILLADTVTSLRKDLAWLIASDLLTSILSSTSTVSVSCVLLLEEHIITAIPTIWYRPVSQRFLTPWARHSL